MPKAAYKNVDRYKIQGGDLNQHEFQQNQQDEAEQQNGPDAHQTPDAPVKKKSPAKAAKKSSKKSSKKATKTAKKTGKKTAKR